MAAPFPFPLSATQVGTYFVGQYYHVLETKPELVYQFYSDASTMIRIDGNARDNATAMLQIHALIMSISFTGIGIKTVQCLESWSGGVLISVFGSAQLKDYNVRRKFMQSFFLAPQEKGFFVLNDIFQFVDEEPIHNLQPVFLAHSNFDSKLNAPSTINKPVSNYLLGGDIRARDFLATNEVKENGSLNTYGFSQQQMAQVHEPEHVQEDVIAEESHGFLQPSVNNVQEHAPSSVEELPEEPLKHTYASIVAKGQVTPSVASQPSLKSASSLDKEHSTPTNTQQTPTLTKAFERSEIDVVEDIPTAEDEDEIKSVYVRNLSPTVSASEIHPSDEIKSVYVRNLSPTVSASEIEEELKNFGRIQPDGVVIRSRKDVGVCYAFVEFEDMNGVHNAVKAGSVEVAGRQVYIEERRPNSNIPSRGGRRGRGRSSFQSEAQRGRFGPRSYGRGNGQDGSEREYNKTEGNAFYRPTTRQERGY